MFTVDIGRGIVFALALFATWGGSIYNFFLAWRETRMTAQLERHGVTAPGKMTSWNVPMGRRTGSRRKVAFTYQIDGTTYKGNQILWKTQLQAISRQEQQIEVRYLPGNPRSARLDALFMKTPMVFWRRMNGTALLLLSCPLLFLSLAFLHVMPQDIGVTLAVTSGCGIVLLTLVLFLIALYVVNRRKVS